MTPVKKGGGKPKRARRGGNGGSYLAQCDCWSRQTDHNGGYFCKRYKPYEVICKRKHVKLSKAIVATMTVPPSTQNGKTILPTVEQMKKHLEVCKVFKERASKSSGKKGKDVKIKKEDRGKGGEGKKRSGSPPVGARAKSPAGGTSPSAKVLSAGDIPEHTEEEWNEYNFEVGLVWVGGNDQDSEMEDS